MRSLAASDIIMEGACTGKKKNGPPQVGQDPTEAASIRANAPTVCMFSMCEISTIATRSR